MRRFIVICLMGLLWGIPPAVAGETVTEEAVGVECDVKWTNVQTAGIHMTHLYLSRTPGNYPQEPVVSIPMPTMQATCEDLNLTEDGRYYLVATAMDVAGNESAYSNEVTFITSREHWLWRLFRFILEPASAVWHRLWRK